MKSLNLTWKVNLAIIILALGIIIFSSDSSASTTSENGYTLDYRVDEGQRRELLNETQTYFAYSIRASNQPQVLNETGHRLDLTPIIKPPFIDDIYNLFDFKMLSTEIVWFALSLVFDTPDATIDFMDLIDFSKKDSYNLTKSVDISPNYAGINATELPELNKAARVKLKSLSFTRVRILKDGAECTDCTLLTYTNGDAVFDVMGFGIYQAAEGFFVPALRISMGVKVLNATFNVTGVKYNNSYPKNVSVMLGNTYTIYNMSGTLDYEATVNESGTELDSLISGGCVCAGCTLINSGLTCLVDINVDAKSQGGVVLSDLNVSQIINNVSWLANTNKTMIDLDDYFFDRNRNTMTYGSAGTTHISVLINQTTGIVKLVPQIGWTGIEYVVFSANDSINVTLSNNVTLTVYDNVAPTWSNLATNLTAQSTTGNVIRFNVTWTDNVNLSSAIFSWNDTGTWVNFTTSNIYKTSYNYTTTKTITAAEGKKVHYRFYAKDTSGNTGSTGEGSFTAYTMISRIGLKLLYPTTDPQYVIKDKFFNVTVNVSCGEKDCGVVNVTLDPITSETIAKDLYYPAIALDTNGYLHMVGSFMNSSNNYLVSPYYCNNSAGTWRCEKINNDLSLSIPALSIAIDSNNKVHVINGPQYCKKTTSTWTCENIPGITSGVRTSLALDKNNKPHVSFSHSYEGREDNMHPYRDFYELGYCNKTGSSWSCAPHYGTFLGPIQSMIAISSNNVVYVSIYVNGYSCPGTYMQNTYCEFIQTISLCNRTSTSSTWSCAGGSDGSSLGSLSLSQNNIPSISSSVGLYSSDIVACKSQSFWYGDYLRCESLIIGARWQIPVYSSIAVDELGYRHVVYTDKSTCAIKYCTDSGGEWNCGIVAQLQKVSQWSSDCRGYTTPYGQGLAIREGNLANSTKYSPYLHLIYRNAYTGNLTVLDFPTGLQKVGIIPKTTGAVPFYTLQNNPYSVTLNKGQSSIVTWNVNASGYAGTTHTFFVFANKTSAMSYSNRTSDWTVKIIDPPKVYLSSPVYGSFLNTTAVNFTYVPIIENLDTCILYGNFDGTWKINKTSTGLSLGNPVSIIFNVTAGSHIWNVKCNDTNNVVTWASSNSTFFIDTVSPTVFLHFPLNNSLLISEPVYFNWTAYDDFDTNIGCNLRINGTTYTYMQTINGTMNSFEAYNMSSFIYHWNVTCFDTTKNMGTSDTWIYPRRVLLNSTYGTNTTTENLTANYVMYPEDKAILNWYRNNKNLQIINMPFEVEYIDGQTNKFRDYSGNNNHGTKNLMNWYESNGHDGGGTAYFDDDNDDYIIIPEIKFNSNDKWSISFWAKKDVDSTFNYKGDIAGNRLDSVSNNRINVGLDNVYFSNNLSSTVIFDNFNPDISWHFYHLQFYGTYAELYVDGNFIDSKRINTAMRINTIGWASSNGAGYNFRGYIDDLILWNTTLSPTQVEFLYQGNTNKIASSMTYPGDVWKAKVLAVNSDTDNTFFFTSNDITLSGDHFGLNYAKINSTYGTNNTDENITAYISYDSNVDIIYNWYRNTKSMAILNMPFDVEENPLRDYSSNANNGTSYNVVWFNSSGHDGRGTAYFDDDNDDYIIIPEIQFSSNDKWSISFWAKKDVDSTFNYKGDIVGNRLDSSAYNRINVGLDNVFFYNNLGGSAIFDNFNPDTSWHFYHLQFYGTYAELYVDGKYKDGDSISTPMKINTIGWASSNGVGYDFAGYIDDLILWNTTFTPTQIDLFYNERYDLISSATTKFGDVFQAKMTPNDGLSDGTTRTSNTLTVNGDHFGLNHVKLNSSHATNYSTENITSYANYNLSVDKIYNWYKNNNPLDILNLPFDVEESPARDFSPRAKNGTVTGAKWNSTMGHDGAGAYYFDGDVDYISLPFINLSANDRWSISFWAKKINDDNNGDIIGNRLDTYTYNKICIDVDDVKFVNSAGTTISFANFNPDTNWHFYTIIGHGSYEDLYVDGIYRSSDTVPSSIKINTIGYGSGASSTFYMAGYIDEMMMWNTTLTPSQVNTIYNGRYDLISSGMNLPSQIWSSRITPHDTLSAGVTRQTNQLTVKYGDHFNRTYAKLNSTSGMNYTTENITVNMKYETNNLSYVYEWYKNGKALKMFDMPFDVEEKPTRDYSIKSNNGTVTNAKWQPDFGYNGKGAYYFDAAGDYIGFSFINLTANDRWSISFWAKKNADDVHGDIMGNRLDVYTLNRIAIIADNVVFYNSVGGAGGTVLFSNFNPDTDWHFYTLVGYGASEDLYVDGTYRDSGAVPSTIKIHSIGKASTSSSYDLNGYVDEVIIWNTTLKPSQIRVLYSGRNDRLTGGMTDFGDSFYAKVTPNDGLSDGATVTTNTLTINQGDNFGFNNATLRSSFMTNYSTENLTASASYTASVQSYYRFTKNNKPLISLNLPFNTEDNPLSDYSYQSNTATAVDARWYPYGGHDGKGAYYFDAIGDYISLSKWINFTANDRWTLSFWFKKTADDDKGDIVGNRLTTFNFDRISIPGTTGNIIFYNSGGGLVTFENSDLAASTWYFISIVAKDNGLVELYINGKLRDTDFFTAAPYTGIKINTIGKAYTSNNYDFGGYLDDIMIWNTSLTTTQINQIYAGNMSRIISPIMAAGDTWQATIIPTDSLSDGSARNTNTLTVRSGDHFAFNYAKLNSTYGTNYSIENITAYFNYNRTPALRYNWYFNNKSLSILNMPFDSEKNPLRDYSKNGNNATPIAIDTDDVLWNITGGYNGKGAYKFGSADYVDYLTLSRQITFTSSDRWSTSFWFKKSVDDAHGDIIGNRNNVATTDRISVIADRLYFYNSASGSGSFTNFNSIANRWYFVTLVCKGSSADLYVDGRLNQSLSLTTSLVVNTIGRATNGNANDFGGYIDELMIWNRTLNASEVNMVYNGYNNKMSKDMLSPGQVWRAEAIPHDYLSDGVLRKTNNITIRQNNPPTISMIYPNSTFQRTTRTTGIGQIRLTEPNNQYFNISYSDPDKDNRIAWYINGVTNTLNDNKNFTSWIGNYSQQSMIRNITVKLYDNYGAAYYQWNVSFTNTELRNLNQTANKTSFVSTWSNLTKIWKYEVSSSTSPTGPFTYYRDIYGTNKMIESTNTNGMKKFYRVKAISIYGEELSSQISGYWKVPLRRKAGSLTKNWVAIPLNNTNLKKAHDLLIDTNATSISYFNSRTQTAVTCNRFLCPEAGQCTSEACNFNLLPGQMYEVTINHTGVLVYNWTMAGLVKDKTAIQLVNKSTGYSRNWIAIKPNSTSTMANSITSSIGANLSVISMWNSTSQTSLGYLRVAPGSPLFIGKNFATDPSVGNEVWVYKNTTWVQS